MKDIESGGQSGDPCMVSEKPSYLFKTKNKLNYVLIFSPYRAVNTLRLGYKNQSVNAV